MAIFGAMLEIGHHMKNIRHVMLTWFVLFSLSPCTVKEAWFHSVGIEYTTSLNKSRTTTQTNACQYSSPADLYVSVVKQSKSNKQTEPVDVAKNHPVTAHVVKIQRNSSKASSGSSPPKYILYKRLKIAIA